MPLQNFDDFIDGHRPSISFSFGPLIMVGLADGTMAVLAALSRLRRIARHHHGRRHRRAARRVFARRRSCAPRPCRFALSRSATLEVARWPRHDASAHRAGVSYVMVDVVVDHLRGLAFFVLARELARSGLAAMGLRFKWILRPRCDTKARRPSAEPAAPEICSPRTFATMVERPARLRRCLAARRGAHLRREES